jgi:hypothetical protein
MFARSNITADENHAARLPPPESARQTTTSSFTRGAASRSKVARTGVGGGDVFEPFEAGSSATFWYAQVEQLAARRQRTAWMFFEDLFFEDFIALPLQRGWP